MEVILEYFEHIPPSIRGGIFILGMVIIWITEGLLPLFAGTYNKVRHGILNLALTGLNFIIGVGLAWVLLSASQFTMEFQFGLLFLIDLPVWLWIVLGVVLLDLIGAYFAHWTLHKIKWMWKFHVIHHSDMHVDVTSGFRHHPGEILIRTAFTAMGVLILGLPMGVIMIYQTLSLIFTQITHANIRIPDFLDRPLSYLFVTPNMHKVHHHFRLPKTDSNYGNIFSIWDRVFSTFIQVEKTDSITYGIDTHMDPDENENIGNLLAIPFQKYREPEGRNLKKI